MNVAGALAVDLGPFFPPGTPTMTWEWDNPLAYFNLAAFIVSLVLVRRLGPLRAGSGLAQGSWAASLVIAIGTGLHFVGDVTGVSEAWDHQFIHLVLLVAVVALLLGLRRD
jgi:hypothetical protein